MLESWLQKTWIAATLSFFLGFGLACIMSFKCPNNECKFYDAPPKKKMEKTLWKWEKKCYRAHKHDTACQRSTPDQEFVLDT
jgi:hypothetical protein